MSNLIYPSYKNYVADSAYVYPAANRSDGGEDNSEKNLRTLTDKFAIKSFIVKRRLPEDESEYFNITFNSDSKASTINIDRGECSIRGFYLDLAPISATFEELDLKVNTLYNITIFCVLDSAGLLSGDGRNIVGNTAGQVVSRGVRLQFLTDYELSTLDSRYPYLLLGQVHTTVDGYFNPSSLVMDISRYSFINSSTILSDDNKPIEVWVNERIEYETSHLDQLNHYLNESDSEPSSFLKIVPVYDDNGEVVSYDVVLHRETSPGKEDEYPSEVSLSEIEQRTRPSESEGYTVISELKDDGPLGSTYNGTFASIARSDHLHDNRYVHKIKGNTPQIVQTPVQFDQNIVTKGGISGSNFSISDDGSASFSNGAASVDSSGNARVSSLTATGDITAKRVFNAVWNDYAEFYRKDNLDEVVEPGTVIAKVRGKDAYAPVNSDTRGLVVGVCSDTYGHILGGDQTDINENLRNFIPVALAGRVRVKVVQGVLIKEGNLLIASEEEGRATVAREPGEIYGRVVGKALESSHGDKDRILIQVMLG